MVSYDASDNVKRDVRIDRMDLHDKLSEEMEKLRLVPKVAVQRIWGNASTTESGLPVWEEYKNFVSCQVKRICQKSHQLDDIVETFELEK